MPVVSTTPGRSAASDAARGGPTDLVLDFVYMAVPPTRENAAVGGADQRNHVDVV